MERSYTTNQHNMYVLIIKRHNSILRLVQYCTSIQHNIEKKLAQHVRIDN